MCSNNKLVYPTLVFNLTNAWSKRNLIGKKKKVLSHISWHILGNVNNTNNVIQLLVYSGFLELSATF